MKRRNNLIRSHTGCSQYFLLHVACFEFRLSQQWATGHKVSICKAWAHPILSSHTCRDDFTVSGAVRVSSDSQDKVYTESCQWVSSYLLNLETSPFVVVVVVQKIYMMLNHRPEFPYVVNILHSESKNSRLWTIPCWSLLLGVAGEKDKNGRRNQQQ